MSDTKVVYHQFMVSATETLVVKEGADAPKVLIKPELVLWDGIERDLETETWLRPELQSEGKKYNTKTATVVCRPF